MTTTYDAQYDICSEISPIPNHCLWADLEATVDHLDALWVNHKLIAVGSGSLQQRQRNTSSIDNLALLTNVINRVGQIRSEEAAEINGMTTNDDIVLVDTAKNKFTKLVTKH